jgi:hypothetical protein
LEEKNHKVNQEMKNTPEVIKPSTGDPSLNEIGADRFTH